MKNIKLPWPSISGLILLLLVSCGKQIEETRPIRKDISETVFASGVLEADGKYTLMAQTNGYITKINFDEGDVIKPGCVLIEIQDEDSRINLAGATDLLNLAKAKALPESPSLMQAKTQIEIAKDRMDLDSVHAERYARLLAKNSISKLEYENARLQYEIAQKDYRIALEGYEKAQDDAKQSIVSNEISQNLYTSAHSRSKIRALQGGKVYKKYKGLGDYIKAGEVIAEIADPDLIYALVNVDESNIAKLSVGQEATIQLNTNTSKSYSAKVEEILPSFDEATQSFLCKLYFVDELDFRIVNTQLQANILIGEAKSALLIPRNYLDFGGYVQVKGEEGKTKVETQFVSSEWVQVTDGLDEDVVLITDEINPTK